MRKKLIRNNNNSNSGNSSNKRNINRWKWRARYRRKTANNGGIGGEFDWWMVALIVNLTGIFFFILSFILTQDFMAFCRIVAEKLFR